ncbi:uncharacterized protein LOC143127858 [Alosa pseudoharengus]|uniref:uncharacterized protein LOC143127858 n=1 Tax=Alosa pseudoharengus TaxID=34774 RepID=UPI003F892C8F
MTPKPKLTLSPGHQLLTGDSVTLRCELGVSSGLVFYWYRHTQTSDPVNQTDGNSYSISSVKVSDGGQYWCRAGRGDPVFYTQYSDAAEIKFVGVSPKASVIIHSNWTQIFTSEPLSLSCGVQGNSTGWRLRWVTGRGGESKCPTDWRSETGSSCSIRSASPSDSGVYWCQSDSGEQSNPVKITVHGGDVILESPVHPVAEGDPLTLRCRYRHQPSNISADFYKDGTLLQTSTTGEMTIPAVSRSHEGLYKCSNPERGESPESWVTVRVSDAGSSMLVVAVSVVMGLLVALTLVISLVLLYRSQKVKSSSTVKRNLDQQQQTTNQSSDPDQTTNQSSDPDQRNQNQRRSTGSEGAESQYMPLQKRSTDDYETLTPLYVPLQKGATDVYETIKSSKDSQEDYEEGYDDVDLPDTYLTRDFGGETRERGTATSYSLAGCKVTFRERNFVIERKGSDVRDDKDGVRQTSAGIFASEVRSCWVKPTLEYCILERYKGETCSPTEISNVCRGYATEELKLLWFPRTCEAAIIPVTVLLLLSPVTVKLLLSPVTVKLLLSPVTVKLLLSPVTVPLLLSPVTVKLLLSQVTVKLLLSPVTVPLLLSPVTEVVTIPSWQLQGCKQLCLPIHIHTQEGWKNMNEYTQPLDVSHSGDYTCIGYKNKAYSKESEGVKLQVLDLPKPKLTVEPQSPVYVGETVTLKCEVESTRHWKYVWYKNRVDDKLCESDENTHTITAKSHEKHYLCQVKLKDLSSQMSEIKYVEVKDPPLATVAVESPQRPFYAGETVTLRCDIAEYTDRDQYDWYKDSKQISGQNRKSITISLPDDAGQYTCKGRRGGQPRYSQSSAPVSISVKALPTATLTVQPETPVFTGEEVTLKCEIESESFWKYKWYKYGNRNVLSQGDTNTFTITAAAESHEGQYWCQGERRDRPTASQPSRRITIDVKALPTATVTVESPEGPYYPGDEVTLRCDIAEYTDWNWYAWYEDGYYIKKRGSQAITIYLLDQAVQYLYTCEGSRVTRPKTSQRSTPVSVSVRALPAATLTVTPQSPVFTGESVTLSCDIKSYSGWTYKWFKDRTPEPKLTLHPGHQLLTGDLVTLRCELGVSSGLVFYWYRHTQTSDPVNQTDGNSYSISSVKVSDRGQYWCRAGRGDPVFYTQYSDAAEINVTVVSPKASVVIHSNWTQIFTSEPLSLSCGVQGNSTGWRLRWVTDRGGESKCPTDWRSETGSSCSISSASPSDSGVYWCQSESGEQSNPVKITVHGGNAILESPVHPVTEGDPLTLRCRYRHQPSNISADFYKDETLLQTSTTGEMTIPAVSRSHEGLYKCSNPERGESPESRVTVRVSDAGSSMLVVAVRVVMGLLVALTLVISLVLLYRSQRAKGSVMSNLGPQQSNSPSSTSQTGFGGAMAGTGDVVYAEIELKDTDNKKKAQRRATMSDTLYSLLRPVKSPVSDGGGDGSSDVTYANAKPKKHKKQDEDSAGPSDVTYADVEIKMKPLGSRAKPTNKPEEHLYSAVKLDCSASKN